MRGPNPSLQPEIVLLAAYFLAIELADMDLPSSLLWPSWHWEKACPIIHVLYIMLQGYTMIGYFSKDTIQHNTHCIIAQQVSKGLWPELGADLDTLILTVRFFR